MPRAGNQTCWPRILPSPPPPSRPPPALGVGNLTGSRGPVENQPPRSAVSRGHLAPANVLSGRNMGLLWWKEHPIFRKKLEMQILA